MLSALAGAILSIAVSVPPSPVHVGDACVLAKSVSASAKPGGKGKKGTIKKGVRLTVVGSAPLKKGRETAQVEASSGVKGWVPFDVLARVCAVTRPTPPEAAPESADPAPAAPPEPAQLADASGAAPPAAAEPEPVSTEAPAAAVVAEPRPVDGVVAPKEVEATKPAVAAAAPTAQAASALGRITIMPVKSRQDVDPRLVEVVTNALVAELHDRGLDTVTSNDIATLIGLQAQRQLLQCEETTCLAELAGAFGSERVVYSELVRVEGVTVFSTQLVNTKTAVVERRFLERSKGGDADDLLDEVERAGAELFPGSVRSGTASRRHSAGWSMPEHPVALTMRGGAEVQAKGGVAAVMVDLKLTSFLRVGAGAVATPARAFGAAVRLGLYPVSFAGLSPFVAAEGLSLFGKGVWGGTGAVGLEWAMTRSLALVLEGTYTRLVSAPIQYQRAYFMPAASVAWRP